jgi:hypothetical protein
MRRRSLGQVWEAFSHCEREKAVRNVRLPIGILQHSGGSGMSLVAFLLYRNGIIQETDVMDAQSLPKVQMPNRNGFVPAKPVYPPEPKPSWW